MRFRPCIDLHDGRVKQIVGSSLRDSGEVTTNFVSEKTPSYYADLYWKDGFSGGHVILLGKGNEAAAREAVSCHPGNLQVGGGVTPENALSWLGAGAGKVIVTSYLFPEGELDFSRLEQLSSLVGPENLVLDLSCLPVDGVYRVACNRWQTICRMSLTKEEMVRLSGYCSEFLIHAVQVEGKQGGIDQRLVACLADWSPIPVTYAGGVRNLQDIRTIEKAGQGKVDFTVGSALDLFGGTGVEYVALKQWTWGWPEQRERQVSPVGPLQA